MSTDATRYAKEYYTKQLKSQPPEFSRTCHDCGIPTNDYRCPECWRKLRARHSVSHDTDDSSYSTSAGHVFLRDDFDDLP